MVSLLVNADIDEIIHRGEERTAEINSKYAGLNIDDLNNFKSEFSVKEWEGEEFSGKVIISSLYIRIYGLTIWCAEQDIGLWLASADEA